MSSVLPKGDRYLVVIYKDIENEYKHLPFSKAGLNAFISSWPWLRLYDVIEKVDYDKVLYVDTVSIMFFKTRIKNIRFLRLLFAGIQEWSGWFIIYGWFIMKILLIFSPNNMSCKPGFVIVSRPKRNSPNDKQQKTINYSGHSDSRLPDTTLWVSERLTSLSFKV